MSGLRIVVTPQFRIETDLLQFHFHVLPVARATVSHEPGRVDVRLPASMPFGEARTLLWLHAVVAEELRLQARQYLPSRLRELARRHGFQPTGVTLKNLASRWGSCSSRGHINLNVWLMAAPAHLVDYVLLHELCHLREMNHGPRFWALLDQLTAGRARALSAEMNRFARNLARGNS